MAFYYRTDNGTVPDNRRRIDFRRHPAGQLPSQMLQHGLWRWYVFRHYHSIITTVFEETSMS
jgi:hypothetical protein